MLSLPLPLQIGLGYSVATEKSSQLVDALSTLVSPTELNSNRSPAPSERSLIVMREGADSRLSQKPVPINPVRLAVWESPSVLWVCWD